MIIVVGINIPHAAAATISPQYVQIFSVTNSLTVDGNFLNVYASTNGYIGTTSCGVTATLQQSTPYGWFTYHSWSSKSTSSNPEYAVASASIYATSGKYRLVTTHYVTVNSYTEYESVTSDIKTIY